MSLDPASLPHVQARHYYASRLRPQRVAVVHTPETDELADAAERVARYFATTERKASAHVTVDNNSGVRSVYDHHTAWAAPGANADGLHVEIAGRARQTAADWMDSYSKAALVNAADVVADWCLRYSLPVTHLSSTQLKNGERGIVGHVDVTHAYRRSTHTDPGNGFPWGDFLGLVAARVRRPVAAKEPPMFNPPIPVVAPIAAELFPEWDGHILGHYQLTVEGHIYGWGLVHHYGQPAGDPNVAPKNADGSPRRYSRMALTWTGYDVIDTNGNRFSYGR